MSRNTKLKTGKLAVAAGMLALGAAPLVNADPVGDIPPHFVASGPRALHLSALAWTAPRTPAQPKRQVSLDQPRHGMLGLHDPDVGAAASGSEEERFGVSFPVRWQKEPEIIRKARSFRRQGLPLVHLWQSDSGEHLLAIGLNAHGVPGIYLTQKVPD
jgi:hypothetical protein